MSRRRTKSFDYQKGIYYFSVNGITIKRMQKDKAIAAYKNYLLTQPGKCEWLGKWDGDKFAEANFDKLNHKGLAASII